MALVQSLAAPWTRVVTTARRHHGRGRERAVYLELREAFGVCLTGDTVQLVEEVSIRDLRNRGGDVVDRVAKGERVTITRSGKAVAELRPIAGQPVPAEILLRRWRRLPRVDPERLRTDVDDVLDTAL